MYARPGLTTAKLHLHREPRFTPLLVLMQVSTELQENFGTFE